MDPKTKIEENNASQQLLVHKSFSFLWMACFLLTGVYYLRNLYYYRISFYWISYLFIFLSFVISVSIVLSIACLLSLSCFPFLSFLLLFVSCFLYYFINFLCCLFYLSLACFFLLCSFVDGILPLVSFCFHLLIAEERVAHECFNHLLTRSQDFVGEKRFTEEKNSIDKRNKR